MGLSTLMRGDNTNLSQRLMRWRVGLQFVAVVVIMLFVYLTRGFA
ncbi:twin transmembrane helix small protein [Acinetobacter baumannii]